MTINPVLHAHLPDQIRSHAHALRQLRAALPAYPIEVPFPNLARWREGNTGIDYFHSFDSGKPGPHVMLLALTHGNEVAGAIALDTMLARGLRPVAGRLSLGFVNVAAYLRFNPAAPDDSRYIDEDLNRVWSDSALHGPRDSLELRRARDIRPLLDTVDLLLDIHSMHEASPPLMLCGPLDKGRRLAAELGYPADVIIDAGHANGQRLRDYGGFGDPASGRNALLIETGQHFSRDGCQVALETACRFLLHSGCASPADVAALLPQGRLPAPAAAGAQRFIEITDPLVARSMAFRFTQPFRGMEVIARAGTAIAHDQDGPLLTPYDHCVIVQPSLRQLAPGVTVARLGRVVAG